MDTINAKLANKDPINQLTVYISNNDLKYTNLFINPS